jgi:Holliday junction resolvasome RuvABC endonuclease subunit
VDDVVIGHDLTTCTGWAVFDLGGVLVDSGAWNLAPAGDDHEGERWIAFRGHAGKLLAAYAGRIRAIAYERPSTVQWATARVAFGQAAILEMEAARIGVPTTMISPATAKKAVAGHGRASKQDVQEAVVRTTGPLRTTGSTKVAEKLRSDEADARAIAMTLLAVYEPSDLARGRLAKRSKPAPKTRRKKDK